MNVVQVIFILLVLGTAGNAHALPNLQALKTASLAEQKCVCTGFRSGVRFAEVRETASPLGARTTAEVVAGAEAAIQASVEGAEAGFVIAPLQLFSDYAGTANLQVTLAALEEGRTRAGLGLNFVHVTLPSPQAVGISSCDYDEQAYRTQLDALDDNLKQVCREIVAMLPDPTDTPIGGNLTEGEVSRAPDIWKGARYACGIAANPPETALSPGNSCQKAWTFELAAAYVNLAIGFAEKRLVALGEAESRTLSGLRDLKDRNTDALGALLAHDAPGFTSGISDEALAEAVRKYAWRNPRWTVGADALIELFPFRSGFNPDPETPLPKGELAKWSASVAASYGCGRWASKVGAVVNQERSAPDDSFEMLGLGPTVGLSFVLGTLSNAPLVDENGDITLKDGGLPPRLIVGLDGSAIFAVKRPESQPSILDNLKLTSWMELRFTEKLAIRVGIPFETTTVQRDENADVDPPVPELRKRQYSVPAFVQTVLKI